MKYKFEQLLNRSYAAIRGRGLIKDNTSPDEFILKLHEELEEAESSCDHYMNGLYKNQAKNKADYIEELGDIATVCFMQMIHLGYNPLEVLSDIVEKNEKRANDRQTI